MNDNTELKRLADAAKNWGGEVGEDRWYTAECFKQPYFSVPDAEFIAACDPGSIRALIAENKTLNAQVETFQSDANSWQSGYDEGRRMGTKHMYAEVDRLKAELDCPFRLARHSKRLVEQLRAEVAGLKTGYEAYERVNAELKAENEVLRNALMECADSLQGEMLQKFGGQLPEDMHPVTRREYDRDIAEVSGYRAALGQGDRP